MEEYNQILKYIKLKIEQVDKPIEELQEKRLIMYEEGSNLMSENDYLELTTKIDYKRGYQTALMDVLSDLIKKRDRLSNTRRLKEKREYNKR